MVTPLSMTTEEESSAQPAGSISDSTAALMWLVTGLATVYVILSSVQLPDVIHKMWLDSDIAYYGVLGQLYGAIPEGAHITLGAHAWFEEAAFLIVTRWLPFHKEIWQWFPVLVFVAMTAILGWGVSRFFGRLAAVIVVAVMLSLDKNSGMIVMLQPAAHGNTVLAAVVLGVTLAWTIPRIEALTTRRLALTAAGLGLICGLPLAGDALTLPWCMGPLAVTVGLAARRGPASGAARVLRFGGAIALVTIVSAVLLATIMKHAGFISNGGSGFYTFAPIATSVVNIETIITAVVFPLGGDYWELPMRGIGYLTLATALLAFAGCGAIATCVRRMIGSAAPRESEPAGPVTAVALHTAFWTTCVLAGVLTIAVSTVNDGDTYFSRYLLGPYVGLIALTPLLLRRTREWQLCTCTAVALLIVAAIGRSVNTSVTAPLSTQTTSGNAVAQLEGFALREHVRFGYSTYWDSYDVTWRSNFALQLFPVVLCGTSANRVCTYAGASASSWYSPRHGVRTMVLTDPGSYSALPSPGTRFGAPIARARIGTMTAYVYDYDVASRFGSGQRPAVEISAPARS